MKKTVKIILMLLIFSLGLTIQIQNVEASSSSDLELVKVFNSKSYPDTSIGFDGKAIGMKKSGDKMQLVQYNANKDEYNDLGIFSYSSFFSYNDSNYFNISDKDGSNKISFDGETINRIFIEGSTYEIIHRSDKAFSLYKAGTNSPLIISNTSGKILYEMKSNERLHDVKGVSPFQAVRIYQHPENYFVVENENNKTLKLIDYNGKSIKTINMKSGEYYDFLDNFYYISSYNSNDEKLIKLYDLKNSLVFEDTNVAFIREFKNKYFTANYMPFYNSVSLFKQNGDLVLDKEDLHYVEYYFNDEFFMVENESNKSSIVNYKGDTIVPFGKYDFILDMTRNHILVENVINNNHHYIFLDTKGNEVTHLGSSLYQHDFYERSGESGNVLRSRFYNSVTKEWDYSIISPTKGVLEFPVENYIHREVFGSDEEYVVVENINSNKGYAFYDSEGNIVMPFRKDGIYYSLFKDGYKVYIDRNDKGAKVHILDENNNGLSTLKRTI